jgi:hypothetical protein
MDAGMKIDRLVKNYQAEHCVTYAEGYARVRETEPQLFAEYERAGLEGSDEGAQIAENSRRDDRRAREYMRMHPDSDYREAVRTVQAGELHRPLAEVVRDVLRESRSREEALESFALIPATCRKLSEDRLMMLARRKGGDFAKAFREACYQNPALARCYIDGRIIDRDWLDEVR